MLHVKHSGQKSYMLYKTYIRLDCRVGSASSQ